MDLKFANDLDSIKRLDAIMNSYFGRDRGSVMVDERSMELMLVLLEHEAITVTEHTYSYDCDIRNDGEMMEIYRASRSAAFHPKAVRGHFGNPDLASR